MKRKIKLSFQSLETEFAVLNQNQMASCLGGTDSDPLGNGDCMFNMVSYMLDGSTDSASCHKTDMMSKYTISGITTNSSGMPTRSYDAYDVERYIEATRPGSQVEFSESATSSQIGDALNKPNAQVGIVYTENGADHNYNVTQVNSDGTVKIYDSTNGGYKDVPASELKAIWTMSYTPTSDPEPTTSDPTEPTTPDPNEPTTPDPNAPTTP